MRTLVGLASLTLALGAAALAAERPELAKCATPDVLQRPARETTASGLPPLTTGVRTELPAATGDGGTLPGRTAAVAQEAPPAPEPPPSLPGLAKGAAKDEKAGGPRVAAIQARGDVPEERLLDLGIEIFRPTANRRDEQEKLARLGLSPDTRRSEARYMAFHLRKTLESTGNWGAVRVVPGPGEGLDLMIAGTIVESNGKRLALEIEAHDARGRRWLRRLYRGEADPLAYRADLAARPEAFQEVYNRIANDLLRARDEQDDDDLVTVRRVAALRFAAQLAPEAFSPYLKARGNGRYDVVRFPAGDDPMLRRVAAIRERDAMFMDTLNDYYLGFYDRMSGPYSEWRKHSFDEQDALDRVNRESRMKKILGGAAVLAGLFLPRDSGGADVAGDVAVIGGTLALQAGFEQAKQKGMHETALRELANAFDSDTTPLLVEVEGRQRELSGSAEAQFVAWRALLRQILSEETGAPGDPNRAAVAGPSRSN